MTKSEINAYTLRISQASKSELIVIMYDMAVKYIDDAKAAIDSGNTEEFRINIKRAKSVINELASVLDLRFRVSVNLLSLYTYMNNVMVKADITLRTDDVLRVRAMLEKLHTAFTKVSEQDSSEPLMIQSVVIVLNYYNNASGTVIYCIGCILNLPETAFP